MVHIGKILMDAVMHAAMDFENLNNLLEHTVLQALLCQFFTGFIFLSNML